MKWLGVPCILARSGQAPLNRDLINDSDFLNLFNPHLVVFQPDNEWAVKADERKSPVDWHLTKTCGCGARPTQPSQGENHR
jgi:hypothetical protein